MAKKLIRRYLPDAHKIRDHKHLRLFGSLLVSAMSAAAGYFGMHALWRWHVVREWEGRKRKRLIQKS